MSHSGQRKQLGHGRRFDAAAAAAASPLAASRATLEPASTGGDAHASDASASSSGPVMLDTAKQSAIARQVEDYNHVLDTIGAPNYSAIKSLFSGDGCPPADTTPTINVSFELFETIQSRFSATKQTLERTKADLLTRNQQYTIMQGEMATLKEEYAVLQRRAGEAEARNTQLHQQVAKQDVTMEQLRRELGQVQVDIDRVQERLVKREDELQSAHNRIAESLVTLSQKDAVITTLRRELGKYGRFARNGAGADGADDGSGGAGGAAGAYTPEALQNIAADVEGRTQEARMKLSVADFEAKLRRAEQEKAFILDQHNQYLRHVEGVVAAYEGQCMALQDGVAGHRCVPTPYYLSASFYQDLLAAEKANAEAGLDGDAGDVEDGEGEDAEKVKSFYALTLEARRSLERLGKISIDPTSQLKDELGSCIAAQTTVLGVGADLIGFLSTFEKEIHESRLSLPEVRDEWKKARVPRFASHAAAQLSRGVTTLSTAFVQLLERENEYAAAVAAAAASAAPLAAATSGAGGGGGGVNGGGGGGGDANALTGGRDDKRSVSLGKPPQLAATVHTGTMTDPPRRKHRAVQVGSSSSSGANNADMDDASLPSTSPADPRSVQTSLALGNEGSTPSPSTPAIAAPSPAVAAGGVDKAVSGHKAALEEKAVSAVPHVVDRAASVVGFESRHNSAHGGYGGKRRASSVSIGAATERPASTTATTVEGAKDAAAFPTVCPNCHHSLLPDAPGDDAGGGEAAKKRRSSTIDGNRRRRRSVSSSATKTERTPSLPSKKSRDSKGSARPSHRRSTRSTPAEGATTGPHVGTSPSDSCALEEASSSTGEGANPRVDEAPPLSTAAAVTAVGTLGTHQEAPPREPGSAAADSGRSQDSIGPASSPTCPATATAEEDIAKEKKQLEEAVVEYKQELQTANAELEELRAFKADILARMARGGGGTSAEGHESRRVSTQPDGSSQPLVPGDGSASASASTATIITTAAVGESRLPTVSHAEEVNSADVNIDNGSAAARQSKAGKEKKNPPGGDDDGDDDGVGSPSRQHRARSARRKERGSLGKGDRTAPPTPQSTQSPRTAAAKPPREPPQSAASHHDRKDAASPRGKSAQAAKTHAAGTSGSTHKTKKQDASPSPAQKKGSHRSRGRGDGAAAADGTTTGAAQAVGGHRVPGRGPHPPSLHERSHPGLGGDPSAWLSSAVEVHHGSAPSGRHPSGSADADAGLRAGGADGDAQQREATSGVDRRPASTASLPGPAESNSAATNGAGSSSPAFASPRGTPCLRRGSADDTQRGPASLPAAHATADGSSGDAGDGRFLVTAQGNISGSPAPAARASASASSAPPLSADLLASHGHPAKEPPSQAARPIQSAATAPRPLPAQRQRHHQQHQHQHQQQEAVAVQLLRGNRGKRFGAHADPRALPSDWSGVNGVAWAPYIPHRACLSVAARQVVGGTRRFDPPQRPVLGYHTAISSPAVSCGAPPPMQWQGNGTALAQGTYGVPEGMSSHNGLVDRDDGLIGIRGVGAAIGREGSIRTAPLTALQQQQEQQRRFQQRRHMLQQQQRQYDLRRQQVLRQQQQQRRMMPVSYQSDFMKVSSVAGIAVWKLEDGNVPTTAAPPLIIRGEGSRNSTACSSPEYGSLTIASSPFSRLVVAAARKNQSGVVVKRAVLWQDLISPHSPSWESEDVLAGPMLSTRPFLASSAAVSRAVNPPDVPLRVRGLGAAARGEGHVPRQLAPRPLLLSMTHPSHALTDRAMLPSAITITSGGRGMRMAPSRPAPLGGRAFTSSGSSSHGNRGGDGGHHGRGYPARYIAASSHNLNPDRAQLHAMPPLPSSTVPLTLTASGVSALPHTLPSSAPNQPPQARQPAPPALPKVTMPGLSRRQGEPSPSRSHQ